ncbi:class I SAM-dependent methyltransferase [Robertkochia aurantiaca]|uniref:class I SAM-dependent methyltransferase n=1 Tax=Robertkochia aurantiaca TaxID=2873700 RepID=UPI001CCA23EB|nr:class I SAM-dependent methyltransferase [Robertkochia sp. 3YJGBD-33]
MSKPLAKYTCEDHLVTGEKFQLIPNPEFGYLETLPRPSTDQLGRYYQSDEYISHTDNNEGLINIIYQQVKKYMLGRKRNLIKKVHPSASTVLDYGTGTGDFLKAIQTHYETVGIEPNDKARHIAKTKGLHIHEDRTTLHDSKFDVITMWHVLEHIPDLHDTISFLENHINPGGNLILALPNYKSYDAQKYQDLWAGFDVPRHLWHFDKSSITNLFESTSLSVVQILPMIFDAFYVSLLSEKYKGNKNPLFDAIRTGIRSNMSAMQTGEYSSLIYILKKGK